MIGSIAAALAQQRVASDEAKHRYQIGADEAVANVLSAPSSLNGVLLARRGVRQSVKPCVCAYCGTDPGAGDNCKNCGA